MNNSRRYVKSFQEYLLENENRNNGRFLFEDEQEKKISMNIRGLVRSENVLPTGLFKKEVVEDVFNRLQMDNPFGSKDKKYMDNVERLLSIILGYSESDDVDNSYLFEYPLFSHSVYNDRLILNGIKFADTEILPYNCRNSFKRKPSSFEITNPKILNGLKFDDESSVTTLVLKVPQNLVGSFKYASLDELTWVMNDKDGNSRGGVGDDEVIAFNNPDIIQKINTCLKSMVMSKIIKNGQDWVTKLMDFQRKVMADTMKNNAFFAILVKSKEKLAVIDYNEVAKIFDAPKPVENLAQLDDFLINIQYGEFSKINPDLAKFDSKK